MEACLGTTITKESYAQQSSLSEKQHLSLNADLAAKTFNWKPALSVNEAIKWTAEWYAAYLLGKDMRDFSLNQLNQFNSLDKFDISVDKYIKK